jgi:hypothetical protein
MTAEAQKDRPTPGGDGFLLVACRRPIGGAAAPILRPPRQPFERRMSRRILEHDAQVFHVVGGKPQLALVGQDTGQGIEHRGRDQTAFVMTLLGPGIGEENEDPLHRGFGERLHQDTRIVHEKPHIDETALPHLGQQLRNAVLEDFAADNAAERLASGLRRQMLAAAESKLEPDGFDWRVEQSAGLESSVFREVEAQTGKQRRQELALPGPQLAAAAAAIDDPLAGFARFGGDRPQNAALSSLTRSSRSQEKPPSASGVRPKCP